MPLFRTTGPKGITPELLFQQQPEEKGHAANSAGPQQAQAFQLQMALRKKGIVSSPCFVRIVLLPVLSFSGAVATEPISLIPYGFLAFFAQCGFRSAPGSNCTLHQFRSGIIQEIRSYSHYAFLWSKLFGVLSTFYWFMSLNPWWPFKGSSCSTISHVG